MIEAKSPEFWKLIDREAKITKIADGFKFTEGPVFSRRGYLLFSDIPSNRIHRWESGKLTVFREPSNGANGLTFDHQGRLLACEKGRVTRTEKDGRITVLAGQGLEMPNDLVYAIDGSVYFTDLPRGKVYQVTRKGELRVAAEDCARPNGVALAPNQQKLLVADASREKPVIRVYEITGEGALKNSRVLCDARADGMKTDESGNVWLASGPAIRVFSGEGAELGSITPPEAPSNLGWGAGFSGLYVTARTSVYHVPTKAHGTRTF